MKLSNKYIIYILILIIIFLLTLFALFNTKHVEVQQYLEKVYERLNAIKKQYPTIINTNHNVIMNDNIVYVENIFNEEYYNMISKQFNNLDKYNPTDMMMLRKSSGINFFDLHNTDEFIGCLETYYNNELLEFLSNILKKPIQRTSLSDINSCSLLIYSKKGDHINWHIDNSIYHGDRYVVLYTVKNENETTNTLSQNTFHYIINGEEFKIQMKPNSILLFKGSEIYHKSTAIDQDEKRVLLSMTFCDICQEKKSITNYIHEAIKNTVTYG